MLAKEELLLSTPRKRRKSPPPRPPRTHPSVLDQGNVIHVQWSPSHIYTPTMLVDLFVPLGPVLEVVHKVKSGAFVIFASAAVRVLPGDNTGGVLCASSYEERSRDTGN